MASRREEYGGERRERTKTRKRKSEAIQGRQARARRKVKDKKMFSAEKRSRRQVMIEKRVNILSINHPHSQKSSFSYDEQKPTEPVTY
jgi:hypothetical protein